ncbi:hypothetical protein [Dactylosporangium sp. CA-139066]|uniref:NACHT domain-containing protein n=1 Tax=Dactylosporangium sp. CA-139066 TaxID=3239930 RepID=UPI003D8A20E1
MSTVVIIDNASSAAQVEPLLPGQTDAAVIITSWAPLGDLPGELVALPTLNGSEAVDLLRAVAQRDVSASDEPAVREVARLAGNLPLALTIAAGLLKTRRHWTWTDLKQRLGRADGGVQLDKLVTAGRAVKAAIDLAYRDLDPAAARGYRLLGLAPAATASTGLVRALLDGDDDVLDELLGRELLQRDSQHTLRMHDLLWQRARDLVRDEDPAVVAAAVARMTSWSLAQLEADYLSQFQVSLSLTSPFEEADSARVYIESPLDVGSLTELFPAQRRVVLVAPGGTGKTTMVGHLCHLAALRHAADPETPKPIMALLRDAGPDDIGGDLTSLLRRTLRQRFGRELTPDALQVALGRGKVFVVLDGLDEVIDPTLRPALLAAIRRFADTYPGASLLVTTRPYASIDADLAAFRRVAIAPWTETMAHRYLSTLTSYTPFDTQQLWEWVSQATERPALFGTPFGLQLLAAFAYRFGRMPQNFTMMLDETITATISREGQRGTVSVPFIELRQALESIAFAMQSRPDNRVSITHDELLRQVSSLVAGQSAPEIVSNLVSRSLVLREIEATTYAFTHTAFREHLAAAYLAQLDPPEFVDIVAQHVTDPSWEAVFRAALELAEHGRGPAFKRRILGEAAQTADPGVLKILGD